MVSAIIAAGGAGTRLGAGRPKQLVRLGGVTILQRAVDAFDRCERIDEIVLVVPPALAGGRAPVDTPGGTPLRVVAGGARRQDSVARGFEAVGGRWGRDRRRARRGAALLFVRR